MRRALALACIALTPQMGCGLLFVSGPKPGQIGPHTPCTDSYLFAVPDGIYAASGLVATIGPAFIKPSPDGIEIVPKEVVVVGGMAILGLFTWSLVAGALKVSRCREAKASGRSRE